MCLWPVNELPRTEKGLSISLLVAVVEISTDTRVFLRVAINKGVNNAIFWRREFFG